MIKKIILSLILCCLVISCGKKDDPEYKNETKISKPNILHKFKI